MLKPKRDLVVVKRDKPDTVSAGGIVLVLPGDAGQEPACGEVIAVGPKVDEVKVGERVVIGHYGGDTVRPCGEDLVMLKEKDILGVVEA